MTNAANVIQMEAQPLDLTSRCMLVDLSISVWVARVQDKKAASDATRANNAQEGAGKFHKYLINPEAAEFVQVKLAASALRNFYYQHTLPWTHATRVLPSANFIAFSDGLQKLQDRFFESVEDMLKVVGNLREAARITLGDLFDETEYPNEGELRSKFGVRLDIYPLPASSDFRAHLTDTQVQSIREQIEENMKRASNQAMAECWSRMNEVIGRFVERLSAEKPMFRDSMVTNLRDLCELLPGLNITGDERLAELGREAMAKLGKYDADALRASESLRSKVAIDADALAKKMAGYFGGAK